MVQFIISEYYLERFKTYIFLTRWSAKRKQPSEWKNN